MTFTNHSFLPADQLEKKLSDIDWAIYTSVWTLPPSYKERLSFHRILRIDPTIFLSAIDTGHDYKDFIFLNHVRYDIHYKFCSYDSLAELAEQGKKSPMLLSFRRIAGKMAVVLVWLLRNDEPILANIQKYDTFTLPGKDKE